MLPVTHGDKFTRLHVLLYTVILFAVTLLPFATRMSGLIYLSRRARLGVVFLYYAVTRLRCLQRPARALDFPLLHPLSVAAVRCPADRPLLPSSSRLATQRRMRRVSTMLLAASDWRLHAAAATRPRLPRSRPPTSPAPTSGKASHSPTHRQAHARWRTSRARWSCSSSALPIARTSAQHPRGTRDSSGRRSGRTATGCRCCSLRSIPSATRRRCSKQYVPAFDPGFPRALRGRRRDRAHGQGIQGVLQEAAGASPDSLHAGSHRCGLRLRSRRAAAAFCELWAGRRSA